MRNFIRNNLGFILILLIWLFGTYLLGVAMLPAILLTQIFLQIRGMHKQILFGLIFIIFMSDSRNLNLVSASSVKEVYVVFMGIFMLFSQRNFKPFQQIYRPFLPFVLYSIVVAFRNPDIILSLQKVVSYSLMYLVVPGYVSRGYREEGVDYIADFLNYLGFLLLLGFIFLPFLGKAAYIEGRYSGPLGNPNGLGLYCSVFFILTFIFTRNFPTALGKQEKIFLYLLTLVSLAMCGSRNATVTILLFILLGRVFSASNLFGVIAILSVVVFNSQIGAFLEWFVRGIGLGEFYRLKGVEGGSGRLIAWQFAWEHITREPILGHGFNYTNYIFDLNFVKLSMKGHQGNAHNTFLTFWLDTGIIGLVLFLRGFFLSFHWHAKHSRLVYPAMFALMFSMFFESWFTSALNPVTFQVIALFSVLDCRFDLQSGDSDAAAASESGISETSGGDNSSLQLSG